MPEDHTIRRQTEQYFTEVERPVIAVRRDHPDGRAIPSHHHRRHQLIYGASGVVLVTTPQGTWVMPPQRGMWVPAGTVHNVRMVGEVQTRSLFFEPGTVAGMPERCQVIEISPFMQNLLAEAVDLPAEYDQDGRAGALMTLIRHELPLLERLPLALPIPAHPELARRCGDFLRQPNVHDSIDAWSGALGVTRRTFTRLFRRETGLSFMTWRQQACVLAALPRLAAGEPVTEIAIEFGYDNPAAFTSMFKRSLGASPRTYLQRVG